MQPSGQGSWYVTYHRPDSIAPTRRGSWGDPGWVKSRVGRGPPPTLGTLVQGVVENFRLHVRISLNSIITLQDAK